MTFAKESQYSRIALYLNSLEIGGAESVVVELGNRFIELGFKVDFVLGQAKGALVNKVSTKAKIVDLTAKNAYRGVPALVRYIYKESPDVFLAATELTGLIAVFSKALLGFRHNVVVVLMTTVSRHKRLPIKKKIERILLSWLYPKADEIIAISHGVARDFSDYIGLSPDRIRVIYTPVITPQLLSEAKVNIDHPFFQPGQPPVILGVGRLSEAKGFPLLIQAFALVRRHRPARLLIVGEGEQRPALERLIHSLGLTEEISLPGFVSSPFPYMSKASVFVLSSLWEGLPAVLIEALACGAPVVSTDCKSGPSEILDHGKYGHLVPVNDVEALAQAIEASLNGDHRRPPNEWLDQFRSETIVQEYLKALRLTA